MKSIFKLFAVVAVVSTLTACTGHVENKNKSCGYDYLLHPAISISRVIGGCGDADY